MARKDSVEHVIVDQDTVGQVADGTWQIGVRRTFPLSAEQLWHALLSPEGTSIWLGGPLALEEGTEFTLENGTTGKVTVYRPGSHLRVRWQPAGWERASVVQIRVIAARTGTTVSFHQEQLPDAAARAAMKAHWEAVIEQLVTLAGSSAAHSG
jgi:uncharacterized protein YndB with AHSA1/START domain